MHRPPADRLGVHKDTVRNLEATGDFVVNVVDDALAERMNLTSGDYPPAVDEFVLAGLTAAPSTTVRAPRVREAPISPSAGSPGRCTPTSTISSR